jgi:hypothetical protein
MIAQCKDEYDAGEYPRGSWGADQGGVMRLVIKPGPDGLWWTLVRSPEDDRPLARGVGPCRNVDDCHAAVSLLGGPGLHKSASQVGDQEWRWQVADADGTVVAESAETFDSVAECGYALYELRHELARSTLAPR